MEDVGLSADISVFGFGKLLAGIVWESGIVSDDRLLRPVSVNRSAPSAAFKRVKLTFVYLGDDTAARGQACSVIDISGSCRGRVEGKCIIIVCVKISRSDSAVIVSQSIGNRIFARVGVKIQLVELLPVGGHCELMRLAVFNVVCGHGVLCGCIFDRGLRCAVQIVLHLPFQELAAVGCRCGRREAVTSGNLGVALRHGYIAHIGIGDARREIGHVGEGVDIFLPDGVDGFVILVFVAGVGDRKVRLQIERSQLL